MKRYKYRLTIPVDIQNDESFKIISTKPFRINDEPLTTEKTIKAEGSSVVLELIFDDIVKQSDIQVKAKNKKLGWLGYWFDKKFSLELLYYMDEKKEDEKEKEDKTKTDDSSKNESSTGIDKKQIFVLFAVIIIVILYFVLIKR